jgi:hypothetical protein
VIGKSRMKQSVTACLLFRLALFSMTIKVILFTFLHTLVIVRLTLAEESKSPLCDDRPGQMEIGLLPCLFWWLFLTKKKSYRTKSQKSRFWILPQRSIFSSSHDLLLTFALHLRSNSYLYLNISVDNNFNHVGNQQLFDRT